jgi:hypothetical protein
MAQVVALSSNLSTTKNKKTGVSVNQCYEPAE